MNWHIGLTYVETYNNIDKRSHSVIEKKALK